MDHYIKEERGGVRIQSPICDRQSALELSTDFSLPDYQPEIKRLLRVRATPLPPDRYVGAGNADFTGSITYSVLYAGNDGELYSTTETGEYHFSVPVEMTSDFEWNEGITCDCELIPEHTVGRVSGPRKFSVRCRLRTRVRMWGIRLLGESISGAEQNAIQKLCGHCDAAEFSIGNGDSLQLADEILCDSKGNDLRVISTQGQVFVAETVAGSGIVCCRGEASIKLLVQTEDSQSTPQAVWRRIPFVQDVPVDGAAVNCDSCATGTVSDIQVTVEENRILCEVTLCLQARTQHNRHLSYTRDIYSTVAECETKYSTAQVARALKCNSGNVSVNCTIPLEQAGIRANMSVVDVSVAPSTPNTAQENGKYVVSGQCRCQAILSDGEEYSAQEFEIPYRYECEGSAEAVKDFRVSVEAISARARVDSERIGVDVELAVVLSTRGESEIRLLREAHFSDALVRHSSTYTICYPAADDTLWSVSKRYHRAIDTVSALNGLSDAPRADSIESLAGVKYLLV